MEKIKGTTVAALACGILDLLIFASLFIFRHLGDFRQFLLLIMAILCLLAITLGGISLGRLEKTTSPRNRTISIAGVILGTIPIVFLVICLVVFICTFKD